MNLLKKILKYPVVLAFFLFIFLFTAVDLVKPDREYSEFENKYLTQRPEFTLASFLNNEWTSKYETYLNDQFVLRDDWITLKSICESMLLKIENNGIAYGADDYLFEKFTTLAGDSLAQFERNVGYEKTFIDTYGETVPITFTIIPNAYMILPEKLPEGLTQVDQAAYTAPIYEAVGDKAQVVDFTGALTAHKDEYIFYRTDHHWTTLGAYYAYAAYVESLGMEPVALDSLSEIEVPDFYGTYFSKAKKFDAVADTITYYPIADAGVIIDGQEADGYYDLSKFEVRDKYAAFLRGNNGYTVIKSGVREAPEGQEPSKILVIKDSYANSFVPFLLYNFDEVHVVDLRYSAVSMKELLSTENFDQVLLMYNFMNLVTDTNLYKLGY